MHCLKWIDKLSYGNACESLFHQDIAIFARLIAHDGFSQMDSRQRINVNSVKGRYFFSAKVFIWYWLRVRTKDHFENCWHRNSSTTHYFYEFALNLHLMSICENENAALPNWENFKIWRKKHKLKRKAHSSAARHVCSWEYFIVSCWAVAIFSSSAHNIHAKQKRSPQTCGKETWCENCLQWYARKRFEIMQ